MLYQKFQSFLPVPQKSSAPPTVPSSSLSSSSSAPTPSEHTLQVSTPQLRPSASAAAVVSALIPSASSSSIITPSPSSSPSTLPSLAVSQASVAVGPAFFGYTVAAPPRHPMSSVPLVGDWLAWWFTAIPAASYAQVLGAILLLQLVTLYFFKNPLQLQSGYLTLALQRALGTADSTKAWSMWLHNLISSHAWLLGCALVYWYTSHPHIHIPYIQSCRSSSPPVSLLLVVSLPRAWDRRVGLHMFCFVAAGFAVKSLAKNLIASPRVFWLFKQHNAFYCGTGTAAH